MTDELLSRDLKMIGDNNSPAHNKTLLQIMLHSATRKLLEKSFILQWTSFTTKDLNSSSVHKLAKEYSDISFGRIG